MTHTVTSIPGDGISPEISQAVKLVLREGKYVTRDLGGGAGGAEMTEAIVRAL